MSMNGFHTKTPNANRPAGARNKFLRAELERRRSEAEVRQAAANARTPEEQIKRLDAAGLVATKERAKLAKRIADREAAKNAPPPEAKKTDAKKTEKKQKVAKGQAGVAPTP